MTQSQKADFFRQQHHDKKLLLLPNVWDTLTAKLISSAGFRSLATASFSVAAVNGYEDGEKIPFAKVVQVVGEITKAVDVPVSVDFERGYAQDLSSLADNVRQLLDAGAIGFNIEDREANGKELTMVAQQCKKVETIRETAIKYGVNTVINARTDAYLLKSGNFMRETIERGKAFKEAGADCFYPVAIDNYSDIEQVLSETTLPVNVLLMKPIADLRKLEALGVKRVSLGPGSLRYVLTKLRGMARGLLEYDTAELFRDEQMTSEEVKRLVGQR